MKRTLLVAVLGSVLGFSGVALADGAATFGKKCTSCHGKDGKSDTAMGKKMNAKDLTASKLDVAEIEAVITDGKGKSPPFKGKLSPEEIKELAAYVKSLAKPSPAK